MHLRHPKVTAPWWIPIVFCCGVMATACGIGNAMSDLPTEGSGTEMHAYGSLEFVSKEDGILAVITIEFAETPKQRARGLMDRHQLDAMHGMLFIFDSPAPRGFWMKNTYIPLDIIFVDANRRVVKIAENTTPLSKAIIPSKRAAKYVVEVNAGFSRKHNITEGVRVRWRR